MGMPIQTQQHCNWADIPVENTSISHECSEPDEDEVHSNDGQDVVDVQNAPKPPPDALHPSLGSEAHEEGTCKRCCFFPRGRCTNGYECEFCHYEHEKRKRKNKKKVKGDQVLQKTP